VKRKLLFEEVMNYNKWTSGMASRELGTQRVTLKDLFDKNVSQFPDDAKAEKVLPYPLPSVIEQLGELYINAGNAKMLFKNSLNNPVIQNNKEAKEQVIIVVSKLSNIINELKGIFGATAKPVAKK
jgi:hypothetical protein